MADHLKKTVAGHLRKNPDTGHLVKGCLGCCCPSPGPTDAHDNGSAYTVSGFGSMTAVGCPPASDLTGDGCGSSSATLWDGIVYLAGPEDLWTASQPPGDVGNVGKNPPIGNFSVAATLEFYDAEIGIATDAFIDCPFWYLIIFACYRNDGLGFIGPARPVWVGTKFDGATAAGSYFYNTFILPDVVPLSQQEICGGSHPASLTVS